MKNILLFIFLVFVSLNSFAQIVLPGSSGSGSVPGLSGKLTASQSYTVPALKWARYSCSTSVSNCSTYVALPFIHTINHSGELYAGDVLSVPANASVSCGSALTTTTISVSAKAANIALGYFVNAVTAGTGTFTMGITCIYTEYSL